MVFAMVMIGGITRLTHSGLSMVEWKPLIGFLPPLSDGEWQRVFGLYQATPEYRILNQGMSLSEFRGIFWWEWSHRAFAHLLGAVFILPLVWFWLCGKVRRTLMPRLLGLFALGGLQGVVGWLMVASGLVDEPAVSHYRLAAHLFTAAAIFAAMLWQAIDLLQPEPLSGQAAGATPSLRRHLVTALGLMLITLIWGGLVAGLHAGLIYNTFPLMNDSLLPGEAWSFRPLWINIFKNPATVQFVHRWLAMVTVLTIVAYWLRTRPDGPLAPRPLADQTRQIGALVVGAVLVQLILGVTTLLTSVPVVLATVHQATAFVVLGLLVWALHDLRPR
jgi:cytochrome c oxidase assembly protein subunit 15